MSRVFKFPLKVTDQPQSLTLPVGAQIVLVAPQREQLCIWIDLNTDSSMQELRRFAVHGTGHDIGDGEKHVGSVLMEPFVWHVYEVTA